RMIVALVAVILIIIIGVTSQNRTSLTKFEKLVGGILSPINKLSSNMGNKLANSFTSIKNITKLSKENQYLKKELAELKETNRDLEKIVRKYDFLKNEAELLKETNHDLVSAQITSKEPGNWYDIFTIDKGESDGIKRGATVIQGVELEDDIIEEGIVGRIGDVGDNWAKVVSVIDETNKISFKTTRTQDGGIVSGNIDNLLSGYLYDSKADIVEGDKLYTSGLGKIFVKNVYIGEIEEVIEVEEELTKK